MSSTRAPVLPMHMKIALPDPFAVSETISPAALFVEVPAVPPAMLLFIVTCAVND